MISFDMEYYNIFSTKFGTSIYKLLLFLFNFFPLNHIISGRVMYQLSPFQAHHLFYLFEGKRKLPLIVGMEPTTLTLQCEDIIADWLRALKNRFLIHPICKCWLQVTLKIWVPGGNGEIAEWRKSRKFLPVHFYFFKG